MKIEKQRDRNIGRGPEQRYYAYNAFTDKSEERTAMKQFFNANRSGIGHRFLLKEVDSAHSQVAFFGGKASTISSVSSDFGGNASCLTDYVAPCCFRPFEADHVDYFLPQCICSGNWPIYNHGSSNALASAPCLGICMDMVLVWNPSTVRNQHWKVGLVGKFLSPTPKVKAGADSVTMSADFTYVMIATDQHVYATYDPWVPDSLGCFIRNLMKSEEPQPGQGNRLWVSESQARDELAWDGGSDGRTTAWDYDIDKDLTGKGFLFSMIEFSNIAAGVKELFGLELEIKLFKFPRISGSYELVFPYKYLEFLILNKHFNIGLRKIGPLCDLFALPESHEKDCLGSMIVSFVQAATEISATQCGHNGIYLGASFKYEAGMLDVDFLARMMQKIALLLKQLVRPLHWFPIATH